MNNKSALVAWITAAAALGALVALLYLLEGHLPTPARVWRLGVFGAALRYFFAFVGVWLTYVFAKSFVQVSPAREDWLGELKQYLLCIGACALLAYGSAVILGTHQEDSDPVFGGGETVVDYEPTQDERSRHGLIAFLCLSIPALYGTHEALQESRARRRSSNASATN